MFTSTAYSQVLKDKKPPQNLKGYIKHGCLSESALFIHKPVHVGLLFFRAIVGQIFSQFCTFVHLGHLLTK
jgi:hypothetical protein